MVTRCGRRLANSAAVGGNAAATGTWPAWDNGFISSIRVGLVRVRVLTHRWPTQNLDQLHQQKHRLQQMCGISWPAGRLLPAPIGSHTSVQHANPDPPQHCHRHHCQCQHSKALKLLWVHRVHFVCTKTRPATNGARFGAKQSATNSPTHCSAVALSHTAHCMACRGSAVRIRLAPLIHHSAPHGAFFAPSSLPNAQISGR